MQAVGGSPSTIPLTDPAMAGEKKEGDISDAFASLSGAADIPLPDRFRELKMSLSAGHVEDITASWVCLLDLLKQENEIIGQRGSGVIPEMDFASLATELPGKREEIKKCGVCVIRGVIPEAEARGYKNEVEEYIRVNPQTKGFPSSNPQVWELYWSPPQIKARAHPNLVEVQKTLMTGFWHSSDPDALIDLSSPLTYADRLRIRQPGDAKFALGPHQDGGSVERWEREGYGAGGVYDEVFGGRWEQYDPWDARGRVGAVMNRYNGLGNCSMFRAWQGWLSVGRFGPNQGTLLVSPLVQLATAYLLLRPFFAPVRPCDLEVHGPGTAERAAFLDAGNWRFTAGAEMDSELHGARPGYGQEFPSVNLHPHLELDRCLVHVPEVRPGDYVAWHCDVIHAVDRLHRGTSDSSVMYIPVCPVTEGNARYLARQRATFLDGSPSPDFPGGKGESEHVGRPTPADVGRLSAGSAALRSLGLERLVADGGSGAGAHKVIARANAILGLS